MTENIFAVFAGIVIGIITGLLPGIHINSILVLLNGFFDKPDFSVVLFVVSLSIANQVASFIPAVLLGVPSENNFLSVLPGHAFARKGLGLYAIRLAVSGTVIGFFLGLLFIPLLGLFLEKTANYFSIIIPFALLAILFLMVWRENEVRKKFFAAVVVFLSALAGVFLLNNSLFNNNLFVLVTGFFGMPTMLLALNEKYSMPRQKMFEKKINLGKATKTGFLGIVSSCIGVIFPALGPNETIFLAAEFSGKTNMTNYMLINGAVSTMSFLFSFAALFFIGHARNGSAVFVKQFAELSTESFAYILVAATIACAVSALAAEFLAVNTVKKISRINYQKINLGVIVFITVLAFFSSGFFGLIALGTTTAIGLLCAHTKISRTACMAFLIVPTILFYSGL